MTGDDAVEVVSDVVKEGAEFDALVTEDVGARCSTCFELIDRHGDDAVQILSLKRHDFEWNVESVAYRSRVAKVFFPRTFTKVSQFVFQPDLQVEGPDVIASLVGELKGD